MPSSASSPPSSSRCSTPRWSRPPCLAWAAGRIIAKTGAYRWARIDPRAEIATGDLDTFDPALLDGVERVFILTSGHGSDGLAQEQAVAKAATGVAQLVKLSTTGVHFGQTDPLTGSPGCLPSAVTESSAFPKVIRRRHWCTSATSRRSPRPC